MAGGGKKGGGTPMQRVAEYYMSIHYGWCAGPVDAIWDIWIGEKLAWTSSYGVRTLTNIYVNWLSLFGGINKEGGVLGNAYFLPGSAAQVMPQNLASRLGRSSATCPAFRGQAGLFFCEGGNFSGFLWGANNPYIKTVWARITRMPKGLSSATAAIGTNRGQDANPAHIIFECLTNPDWGMGASPDLINIPVFEAVATTLFNENFGLSMVWTKASKVEAFISEVLNHIQGTLFIDPQTGLYTLKLIRNDYDISVLPVFGPDNATLSNYQVKAWGETINEIVVTYTDPITELDNTYSLQNIANIALQGGQIVSDSRNYYGIHSATLAAQVAGRDLQSASSPLRSADMVVNRKGWSLTPGEPLILTWPEYQIDTLVMRVMNIDYGKPGDGVIKVSLLEDVFSAGVFIEPAPPTMWIDPGTPPAPFEFFRPFTLPAAVVANVSTQAGTMEDPEVMFGVLAAQSGSDTSGFQVNVQVTRVDGSLVYRNDGRLIPVGYSTLTAALAAEATSVTQLPLAINGRYPQQEGFVFFGNDTEDKMEIARLHSFDTIAGWTIDRGVFDTTPRAWPIGTPVWYVATNARFHDPNIFTAGEVVTYKLTPQTSKGILDITAAPVETITLTDRPHLPNRPGNVMVGGVGFAEYDATAVSSLNVTWANRNRLMEDTVVVQWGDGNVTPEVGQTTTITLMNAIDRSIVLTLDGLTGTSHTIPKTSFGGLVEGIVRVTAKRDGLESLQGHEITVLLRPYAFAGLYDAEHPYTGHAGKFVRVNAAGTGLIYIPGPTIQVGVYQVSSLASDQIITRYVTVEAWQLRANLAGCQVNVGNAAVGTPVINVNKNGVSVGTISITGVTPTFATTGGAPVSFAIGDILDLTGPAVADATLAKLAIVLIGPKV